MWCGQEDALKSVHLRHAEKCELHAVADEELFILGVVCRGSIGWQRPEDAKPSCSILRLNPGFVIMFVPFVLSSRKQKGGGGTHCDMMKLCRSMPVNVLRVHVPVRRREGESV